MEEIWLGRSTREILRAELITLFFLDSRSYREGNLFVLVFVAATMDLLEKGSRSRQDSRISISRE